MKNQTEHFKLNLQLFAEEKAPEEKPEEKKVDPNKNAIEALKKLKANSVSKEDYEKLEEQNRQLLDTIINGNGSVVAPSEKEGPTMEELAKELTSDKRMTNLEFWKKHLAFRKLAMEQGMTDTLVPVGEKVSPTAIDYASAEKTVQAIQECIDASDNDPIAFNNELRRRGLS